MKRKILLIVSVALVALSITLPALAKPDWFVQIQCEITEVEFVFDSSDLLYIHVAFEGTAGGPGVKGGTVEGVDHLFFDGTGAHLNVNYTITDKDGDQISVYVWGDSVFHEESGQYVFENAFAEVIDETGYPTTAKYEGMVGDMFRDEGFITDFSADPPGGRIHARLYFEPE
jgi:hypothetical protein